MTKGLLIGGALSLLIWAVMVLGITQVFAYGRPVTEPTNQVWPCGYPYQYGICKLPKDK